MAVALSKQAARTARLPQAREFSAARICSTTLPVVSAGESHRCFGHAGDMVVATRPLNHAGRVPISHQFGNRPASLNSTPCDFFPFLPSVPRWTSRLHTRSRGSWPPYKGGSLSAGRRGGTIAFVPGVCHGVGKHGFLFLERSAISVPAENRAPDEKGP